MSNVAEAFGKFAMDAAGDSASGLATTFTMAIIFLACLPGVVDQRRRSSTCSKTSTAGAEVSDIYLAKIGAMVTATVRGQFVIAFVRTGGCRVDLYRRHPPGLLHVRHLLTVLSVIPLGSGIVTIPLGIGMALTGNIAGGGSSWPLFHVIVISNIDNILRPQLVPRSARLQPALMMLRGVRRTGDVPGSPGSCSVRS